MAETETPVKAKDKAKAKTLGAATASTPDTKPKFEREDY